MLLLEKGSWEKYSVVKGTPQKMLDHLLESEIEEEEGEQGRGREGWREGREGEEGQRVSRMGEEGQGGGLGRR